MIVFDEQYYGKLIEDYGYDKLQFERIDFNMKNFSRTDLQLQWLCHMNGKKFSELYELGTKSIITTGVGLSGVPHIGTISQIMKAINFQNKGYNVQIVLGDLDAYNGKNIPFDETQILVDKYKMFIRKLGFKGNFSSILRSQNEEYTVLKTMYLISKYVEEDMFSEVEEDLHEFYSEKGKVDSGMTFRRKQSLMLMIADFLDLAFSKNYENILVFLGVDEHKYVNMAKKIINKVVAEENININFSAFYSRMIVGLNGYPKMSKSFPKSGISIFDSRNEVLNKIESEIATENPHDNVIFQMMSAVSLFTDTELYEAYEECLNKTSRWKAIKQEYADQLSDILDKWSD